MTTPLENTYHIAAIIGILVLLWYTYETYKLRKNSEKTLSYSVRPFLVLLSDPNPYTFVNKSNNVALNIFQFSKISNEFYISEENTTGSALAPNTSIHFSKAASKKITTAEMIRRMPKLQKLFNFIAKKETHAFVVVYEDILGNKLFTSMYGSGDDFDKALESMYVMDIK